MATIYRNFLSGTLSADPGSSGVTITSSNLASLPVVASPDTMWVVLDPDATNGAPEVVLVTAHTSSSTTATVTRAQQSTTARAHPVGTVWRAAATASDMDELPFRKLTTTGDILYGSAANTATRLAIGSSGLPLVSSGTAPQWSQVNTAGIADGAVTTVKIGAAQVTAAKLAADTAGNGLSQAVGGALDVSVDNSTLELSADQVRVKDGGITLAKLAANSVDSSKIAANTIVDGDIASNANILLSKLTAGTPGQIIVGAATTGVPTYRSVTGDVTISDTGATAIAANVIVAGDFAAGAKPVVICTSSTRPGSSVEGQVIYETDTDQIRVYNGTSWVLLTANGSYTPTLTNLSVGTGGSPFNSAIWSYANGMLSVQGRMTFGTTSVTYPSSTSQIAYPTGFTADSGVLTNVVPIGNLMSIMSGTNYMGFVFYDSTSTFRITSNLYNPTLTANSAITAQSFSSTFPTTWAAGNSINYSLQVYGSWS